MLSDPVEEDGDAPVEVFQPAVDLLRLEEGGVEFLVDGDEGGRSLIAGLFGTLDIVRVWAPAEIGIAIRTATIMRVVAREDFASGSYRSAC